MTRLKVGDRVVSIFPHAGGIIQPGDPGTVCWIKENLQEQDRNLIFVSWDNAHDNLRKYAEYGIMNDSGWSVYEYEVELEDEGALQEINTDILFKSV